MAVHVNPLNLSCQSITTNRYKSVVGSITRIISPFVKLVEANRLAVKLGLVGIQALAFSELHQMVFSFLSSSLPVKVFVQNHHFSHQTGNNGLFSSRTRGAISTMAGSHTITRPEKQLFSLRFLQANF